MHIMLNGHPRDCAPTTVASLREHAGIKGRGRMTHTMKLMIRGGHTSFRAGRISRKRDASASSSIDGTAG